MNSAGILAVLTAIGVLWALRAYHLDARGSVVARTGSPPSAECSRPSGAPVGRAGRRGRAAVVDPPPPSNVRVLRSVR